MKRIILVTLLTAVAGGCDNSTQQDEEISDASPAGKNRKKAIQEIEVILKNIDHVLVEIHAMSNHLGDIRAHKLTPFKDSSERASTLAKAVVNALPSASRYPGTVPTETIHCVDRKGSSVELGLYPDRFFLMYQSEDYYFVMTDDIDRAASPLIHDGREEATRRIDQASKDN